MSGQREGDQLVAQVVSSAGGQIVGRVRLQKLFYILDQLGLNSDFSYEYHHYGPYSSDLAEAVEDAAAFGLVSERIERRMSDGVPYSIFESPVISTQGPLGGLERGAASSAIARMRAEPTIILELAATIDWLRAVERVADWEEELVRRKGAKAERDRMERAVALLRDLGLDDDPSTSGGVR